MSDIPRNSGFLSRTKWLVLPILTFSMQAFSDISLHDGIVVCATRPAPETISFRIDAMNNPWEPIGHFDLTFYGVIAATGLGEILDDWWLYEEVHLSQEAESTL